MQAPADHLLLLTRLRVNVHRAQFWQRVMLPVLFLCAGSRLFSVDIIFSTAILVPARRSVCGIGVNFSLFLGGHGMSKVNRVDHIAYAVSEGMIEKWAWYHIEIEGGKLTKRVDDVRPDDPDSSMKLWCIDFESFGVVLVEGIDRKKVSQVTAFADRHGDHSVQHIAFDTENLEQFVSHAVSNGVNLRGQQLVSNDGFGDLKQLFGKGYAKQNAAEMSFPEYVERPKKGTKMSTSVPQNTGKNFYQRIEHARNTGDTSTLLDFSRMPTDWQPEINSGSSAKSTAIKNEQKETVPA